MSGMMSHFRKNGMCIAIESAQNIPVKNCRKEEGKQELAIR